MGTFNPNPGQAPPHLTPSHPSPLCLSNALWRVRHFRGKYKQKVLRVAAAESGNNKYSNDPRWSAMGRSPGQWRLLHSWPEITQKTPLAATCLAQICPWIISILSKLTLHCQCRLPAGQPPNPLLRHPCVRSITQSSGRNWKSPHPAALYVSFPLSLFRLCPHLRQLNNYQRRRQRCCCCFCFIHFPFHSPCPR